MTTLTLPFYGNLNNKTGVLENLAKLARKRKFDYSSFDELGDNIIGLDVNRRQLLYLKVMSNSSSCMLIELKNVESCSIRKNYSAINAGDLSKHKLSYFLKSIFLNLGFKNGSLSLPLFEAKQNNQSSAEQVEAKARKWQAIVSRLVPAPQLYFGRQQLV